MTILIFKEALIAYLNIQQTQSNTSIFIWTRISVYLTSTPFTTGFALLKLLMEISDYLASKCSNVVTN